MSAREPSTIDARVRSLCDGGDLDAAATLVVTQYGDELYGFLVATCHSESDAADAYSWFCEALWKAIGSWRGEASVRTWAYALARHAISRLRRDPHRRAERRVPLSKLSEPRAASGSRTATPPHLRSELKDAVSTLRQQLDPQDRQLFILRIDRRMAWQDVARVMRGRPEEPYPAAELTRDAAAWRKRFERAKQRLRELARDRGMTS